MNDVCVKCKSEIPDGQRRHYVLNHTGHSSEMVLCGPCRKKDRSIKEGQEDG